MDEIKYGKFELISAAASVPDLRTKLYPDLLNGTIHEDDVTKVTYALVISMALSQMPAIALGIFGVMRAFMNHGASTKAVVDCFR